MSTDVVAPDGRVEYWRDAMRQGLAAECRVEPRGRDFGASMRLLGCGPLDLVDLRGQALRTQRLGSGRPGWVSIMVQLAGRGEISDGRHCAQLLPGDCCLVPPERDIVADRPTSFHQVLANVRASDLDAVLPEWRNRLAMRIAADSGVAKALSGLLGYVVAHSDALDGGDRERLGATALHLVEGMVGRGLGGDGAPHAADSRLAAWHRRRIDARVRDHLADPGLDTASIATALGLSVRYLHKLYSGRGHTLMEQVRAMRLEACRREITTRGSRSISEIAYDWGFTSMAHFSRAFRQRYGVPPSLI